MLELVLLLAMSFNERSTGEPRSISQLSWLSGCWSAEGREEGSGEIWTSASGGSLLGISRTVKAGKTVEHEFMQIRERADGAIVFIATPSGQQTAEFPMREISAAKVVFENAAHDFPQRVIYERDGDKLIGSIEGTKNGKTKRIPFPYVKVSCP